MSRCASMRVAVLAASLAVAGCGKSQERTETMPVTGPGAPKGAPSPREAIVQFFEAKRTGNTELGCSLESEDFQRAQYQGTADACLRSSVNQQPQKVWAEEIKIDKLDEAPDSAAARIRPNAGSDTPAEITLVRGDGGWLVNSLR
jgi:hypothetical protein